MRSHTRISALAIPIAVVLLMAACSAGSSKPSLNPLEVPSPPAPTLASAPNVTSLTAAVIGNGSYPGWSVDGGNAWSIDGGAFVVNDVHGVLGVSVWDVKQVPGDPCHWRASMATPGPSVADLVAALVAQRLRKATAPAQVTLAGYHGQYLEWSVPSDMAVTGDSDFAGCDAWPDNGHLDFVSWLGTGDSERYEQVAGQIDRVWVLDVNGQRLVVDATYGPSTTQSDREDLDRVAQSLRFVAK